MIYSLAETILSLCLFLCLALAAFTFSKPVAERLTRAIDINQWLRNFCLIISAGLFACLMILLSALIKSDYSLAYCVGRTSPDLGVHFQISALWAGAEGSLLLWTAFTALAALFFQYTRFYEALSQATALYFWGFFYLILAFLLFLICTFSQPFLATPDYLLAANPHPGLSPILRHPGMIMHPPLIFLSYATLTVPAALGLARLVSGPGLISETPGLRAYLLSAWALSSAGIILGMWWAYTESSWGGYWTWDAVENISLMPWLTLCAALCSNYLERKRNKFFALNSLLCTLPFVAALFATYIVRSGILASKHSYGLSNWSLSLLIFAAFLILLAAIAFSFSPHRSTPARPLSREGLILFQIFLLFALAITIALGTIWPWLTAIFTSQSLRLENAFYLNTCLPLLILCLANALLLPLVSWDGSSAQKRQIISLATLIAATMTLLYLCGFTSPQALLPAGLCAGVFASIFVGKPPSRLIYAGLAILLFGIVMSSSYKEEWQIILKPEQIAEFGGWKAEYKKLEFVQNGFAAAKLEILLTGSTERIVQLEQRTYDGKQVFAQTSFVHGIYNDLGISVMQLHEDRSAILKIVNSPFVNFIWLGGFLMSMAIVPAWFCRRG